MNLPFCRLAALCVSMAAANAYASCGSAFCMVNTNWSLQGVWTEPGVRFDLRYEYINQDQPRAGRDEVAVGQIRRHHDEVKTVNQNLLATLDYGVTPAFGVSVALPIVHREHEHIHNHRGRKLVETWDFTRIGDLRVLGRYQFEPTQTSDDKMRFSGLTFGLKLPTGSRDVANGAGQVAERSLQPGTGTTDLLFGGYYREALPLKNASWFVQGLAQVPLNSRDNYQPGNQWGLDLGYRFDASDKLALMLQLNYVHKGRDRGSEAEPDDSGSQMVSLSPGVSYSVGKDSQLYGFVQKPIYQYVNGVQLTADWSAVVGWSMRF